MLNFSRLFRPFFLFLGVTEMNKHELHMKSLKLATEFAELWNGVPQDTEAVDAALEAYKEARREVPATAIDGRRYGSSEAWEHTQGYIKAK
jgi:hypothetical protein